jgi:Domain of unknown function (DUF1844)
MSEPQMTKHDHILMGLFSSLQAAAMQQMGKIQNPATGSVDPDLEGAATTIDILEMLKVKCRHETPEELIRFMDGAVMDLQMNFLEEKKKAKAGNDEGPWENPSSEDQTEDETGAKA